jgi:hypothetical protein
MWRRKRREEERVESLCQWPPVVVAVIGELVIARAVGFVMLIDSGDVALR